MSNVIAVQIGFDDDVWGTIQLTPAGIHVVADDSDNYDELQALVDKLKQPTQSDQDFMNELPQRLGTRVWGQPYYGQ